MKKFVVGQMQKSIRLKRAIAADRSGIDLILKIARAAVEVYRRGGKLLFAGNGGSAADAQHFAGELVSRFYFDRPALPAIALTTDTSVLTAIGNDYGYERIFARQIEALGVAGDMFVGLSTSGNSPNILKALQVCKQKGVLRVGLTGKTGGKMKKMCDYCLCVPSAETPRIQECHALIGHILCAVIEQSIFGRGKKRL